MKIELLVIAITIFLIVNTYHDGKYTDMIKINYKYLKMGVYGFVGLSIYLFIKKNPLESNNLLFHANNIIKHMPIDKNTADIISPLLNISSMKKDLTPQMKRVQHSGLQTTGRSVSETKKKYIASEQNWKCKKCHQSLPPSFEVNHIVPLWKGGDNGVSNLEALCRNCHGDATMRQKII